MILATHLRGGDYVVRLGTGEVRLVVAYDAERREFTSSGSPRWVSAQGWVRSVALGGAR